MAKISKRLQPGSWSFRLCHVNIIKDFECMVNTFRHGIQKRNLQEGLASYWNTVLLYMVNTWKAVKAFYIHQA
jgi:hypothetical protein